MTRVLVVGVSARAFAQSAVRAGYQVAAVDGFGDLDLRACAAEVHVARAAGRFSARAAVGLARRVAADAVVYEASLDNHREAVRALAAGRALWGNPPAVLARARDPRRLARVAQAAGLPAPQVRLSRPRGGAGAGARAQWLVKPLRSGGGEWVSRLAPGARLPRGVYFQQRIVGPAGSIVFVANGRDAVPLGLSRILAGEQAFGAAGFRYCGNILTARGDRAFAADRELVARATRLAKAVTAACGLVGVNGIDFIARRGVPYAIEVNPRYTAAMELVERAYGVSIFDMHARACAGVLPAFDLGIARRGTRGALGKAILYARASSTLGDSRPWLQDPDMGDISAPGTQFARRDPICTVFARGRDAADCHAQLVRRAAALYRELDHRAVRTA